MLRKIKIENEHQTKFVKIKTTNLPNKQINKIKNKKII